MAQVVVEKRITEEMRKRRAYWSKAMRGKGRILAGEKDVARIPYREGITLDIERARLVAMGYKEAEALGEPPVLQRARGLAKLLDNMTLYILPDERIVGNINGKPDSVVTYPELWWRWLDKALDTDYKTLLSDEERQELHEIHKYFSNKAVHGMERQLLPPEVLPYWFYNNHGAMSWLHGGRTGVANYEKVFKWGLKGILEEAKERLKKLDSNPDEYLAADYLDKKQFLQAVIISLEAGIRYGQRWVKKLTEEAQRETDGKRKKELEEMARVWEQVPANPARTLHEALQCYWFIFLVTRILDLQTPGGGDRFDQIMYPFYRKDVEEEKRLTRLEAQELVEHLLLKMNEEGQLVPPVQAGGGMTLMTARVLTLGGQTREGKDATNEMTYLAMDAANTTKLAQPALAIRLHRDTPTQFLYKIADSQRINAGIYSFFNDEMMIPYLESFGISHEDTLDYSTEGCMRWAIPGKPLGCRALGGYEVLPKHLEYALYQGWDKFSGKKWGVDSGDPRTWTSIEDVIQAYLTQLRFFMERHIAICNLVDVLDGKYLHQPFLSALLDGCIENAQDCRHYKFFPNTIIQPVGQITLVNSLAAIKKLVFDEKKVTMDKLIDALKNNWEGKEELRQMFINAPKFGNDDDYVDLLARDVYSRTTQAIRSFKNIWGGPYLEDGTGGATYFAYSGLLGATPDGRKDRQNVNDGTISPEIGTDKKGPTAVLNSVGKIDHKGTMTHLLNQKFTPQYLTEEYKDVFASYLRTFVDLGIHHIQFNVLDREAFIDAQQNPEEYGDLVIRVAGFSAYFVDLEKGLQDQIIARTEQELAA